MMLGAMLLLSMLAVGQTSKALTEGMSSSAEIAVAAHQTFANYIRAYQAGEVITQWEGNEIAIPSKFWADQIKALKPLKVYDHRGNIVVVQRIQDDIEEGKYILGAITNFLGQNGIDGFEYTPDPQQDGFHAVRDYKRIKDGLSAFQDLRSKLNRTVQNYTLNANNFLDALTHVAADFRLRMGIEWVATSEAKTEFSHFWESVTVEEIIKQIITTQPNYEVQIWNGVLHILPPKLIPDRQNFLMLRITRFQVHQEPFEMVSEQLHNYANDVVYKVQGHAGSIASMPDEPKLDLDLTDTSVEEVLDKIVLMSTRKIWIVVYSDNPATIETGIRRSLSLWSDSPIPDGQQPVWNLFRWGDALPTVLIEGK
jgi:hypothetical protein